MQNLIKLFVLLRLLALTITVFGAAPKIPVVLSTDVGNEIDDQWAITYLLLQPRFEVLGIMSAHAPTIAAPAGQTSYRILVDVVENRIAMRKHPPLVAGGDGPLQDSKTPRNSPAVRFLIDKSRPFTKSNRLTVLMIGAATDVASAILLDPSIVDRIRVIQMGFTDEQGGEEFNVANDVHAVQAILDSNVPLVIGPGNVCRASLSLTYQQARQMLERRDPIGAWLWEEYQAWYFRVVKPLRVDDFSKPWVIWDNITLAYVLGMTSQHPAARPLLRDNMTFNYVETDRLVTWITDVDEQALWADFFELVDRYQKTLRVVRRYPRLTFGMP
ncbi:MAG TPA: nucleoside hydrolase [Pyrinomonadaceae bacterium]|nr:nucleoside hydrolase [Pyrinomonadaceae bacterium]